MAISRCARGEKASIGGRGPAGSRRPGSAASPLGPSALAEGLDDAGLVLGPQGALDGQELRVEQLVETIHHQDLALLLGELVDVALQQRGVEAAVLLELDAAEDVLAR